MTQKLSPSRCATAAIAAALATLSPAAMAQDAASGIAAPAPVVTSAAPPVAPPPQIILPTTQPSVTQPSVQPTPPPGIASAPSVVASPPQTTRRAAPARAVTAAQRRGTEVATSAAAAAPMIVAASTAATPVVPSGAPSDLAAAVPPVVSPTQPISTADEPAISPLELGLIGSGFAVVGLGVISLFLRRRREVEDDGYDGDGTTGRETLGDSPSVMAPRATAQPLPFNPRGPIPPTADHSDTADAGPTAANPFLTRKNRLRRAHFLDRQAMEQRDRDARMLAGQRLMQSAPRPPEKAYPQPTAAAD